MHIDKSTPKAYKNNTLRVYAFGHNLMHSKVLSITFSDWIKHAFANFKL